jgi:hypothetical protein
MNLLREIKAMGDQDEHQGESTPLIERGGGFASGYRCVRRDVISPSGGLSFRGIHLSE